MMDIYPKLECFMMDIYSLSKNMSGKSHGDRRHNNVALTLLNYSYTPIRGSRRTLESADDAISERITWKASRGGVFQESPLAGCVSVFVGAVVVAASVTLT